MLRRLLTILLMLALALQGLAVPHAHGVAGESQPEGHNHRPHFHFAGCHSHHEHGNGHCHSHHHEAAGHHQGSSETQVASESGPAGGHDADAVYIASAPAIAGNSSTVLDLEASGVAVAWVSVEPQASIGHFWGGAVAQPPSPGGIPLYLAALTLRL